MSVFLQLHHKYDPMFKRMEEILTQEQYCPCCNCILRPDPYFITRGFNQEYLYHNCEECFISFEKPRLRISREEIGNESFKFSDLNIGDWFTYCSLGGICYDTPEVKITDEYYFIGVRSPDGILVPKNFYSIYDKPKCIKVRVPCLET